MNLEYFAFPFTGEREHYQSGVESSTLQTGRHCLDIICTALAKQMKTAAKSKLGIITFSFAILCNVP